MPILMIYCVGFYVSITFVMFMTCTPLVGVNGFICQTLCSIIERDDPLPLYRQLYLHIEKAILSGRLEPGQKLPPIRRLAARLGVNTVTVVQAYRCLERAGLAAARVGSGTFVAYQRKAIPDQPVPPGTVEPDQPGLDLPDSWQVALPPEAINFATLTPDAALFPVDDFQAIINQVLNRDRGEAFGYQESQGYPLRCSAPPLTQSGIKCGAETIHDWYPSLTGIDLIARSSLCREIEYHRSPTYTGAMAAFLPGRTHNAVTPAGWRSTWKP